MDIQSGTVRIIGIPPHLRRDKQNQCTQGMLILADPRSVYRGCHNVQV